jgi:hypothetical protein
MLKGQTQIGRVLARCPAGTEPLAARLRLSHLFGGADLSPRGFPPHAVLVIRRATAGRGVALGAHVSRAVLEREVREQVSALWRRAARPFRGRVSESAEAVLFADEGEWLAALALAVARGEVGRHWCWRYTRAAAAGAPPAETFVRAWGESARFVPAAVVRHPRGGEAARVLGALDTRDAGALLSALRAEFDLPHPPRAPETDDGRAAGSSEIDEEVGVGRDRDSGGSTRSLSSESVSPWSRWLSPDGGACARLPPASRRLLAFAAALFHAPAFARSREFAAEVFAFDESAAPSRPADVDKGVGVHRATRQRTRDFNDEHDARLQRDTGARRSQRDDVQVGSRQATVDTDSPARRVDESASPVEETSKARPARSPGENVPRREFEILEVEDASAGGGEAEAHASQWGALEGFETRLGGALFLLNLLAGLRLPGCFDEDYSLSAHITGWGLTELLARELLGETFAEYESDPLWDALARLDGRAEGGPPAEGLRVGESYRAPARWLRLFAPREAEDVWSLVEDEGRLVISHNAGFPVAVLTLGGRAASEVAAQVVDEYRAQGLRVSLRAEGGSVSAAEGTEGDGLRRWMSWTFPFLKYALRCSLDDEGEGAARELLVRRGRLYSTATHVDLVLAAADVSFEARRAGLDASPGWVRDLMRVVAFHFE